MQSTKEAETNKFFREYPLGRYRMAPATKDPKEHQISAIEKLAEWYKNPSQEPRGTILVLPTGGGKTFTAVRFVCTHPLSDGYKVLWLAHTHHLLEQAIGAFSDSAGTIREPKSKLCVRVVSGATAHSAVFEIKPTDDVVIASLQATAKAMSVRHDSLNSFIQAANDKLLVVFDEAHHSPAPSYRRLLQQLREMCPAMKLLGLTATPTYADEKKSGWLAKLFPQLIVYQKKASELMAAGVLSKPIFEESRTTFEPEFADRDYQNWLSTNQDIPEHVISYLAGNRERNEFIANYYVQNKKRLGKTLIFADRWTQCEAICQLLHSRGVTAAAMFSHVTMHGGSPSARNAEILESFRNGKLDVLVNIRMLTEGTDVPDVQTVFLTRQTTSQNLLTQMIGRALRGPAVGGTKEAYIVSFIDNWKQRINWADYELLAEGLIEDVPPDYGKHPPLQLISIDLIRRLQEQMDSGVNSNSSEFLSFLPLGWFRVEFHAPIVGTDDTEPVSQLVLVYEHDKERFDALILAAQSENLRDFEEDSTEYEKIRARLADWERRFFSDSAHKIGVGLVNDVCSIVRHIAQNDNAAPRFFLFADREKHDLDAQAKRYIDEDLGPKSIDESLDREFNRPDLFWSVIYIKYELFQSAFDGCKNRILRMQKQGRSPENDIPGYTTHDPIRSELAVEIRQQVKDRDGHRCLCCGSKHRLRIDHIESRYYGGGDEISNLQTLCEKCNGIKSTRRIDFRLTHTSLKQPTGRSPEPSLATLFDENHDSSEPSEQAIRRWINFFYECAAVDAINIIYGDRGRTATKIRIHSGNEKSWLAPHIPTHISGVSNSSEPVRLEPKAAQTEEKDPEPADDVAEKPESGVMLQEVLDAVKDVENLDVRVSYQDGRKVRADFTRDMRAYRFQNKFNGDKTVSEWKKARFFSCVPILDDADYLVEVLLGNGNTAYGHTKLRTVRESYEE